MSLVFLDGFEKYVPPKSILTRYGKKLVEKKNVCTCTIENLMKHGCQCGQFQREMRLKNESAI